MILFEFKEADPDMGSGSFVRWLTQECVVRQYKKILMAAAVGMASFASVTAVNAQAYPNQAITFVVPYSPGGSSDTRSRQLAQHLSHTLGVSVVVENRPGASGNIGTGQIARAKPDGYTIGLGNFAPMAVNKALYGDSLPFDPKKDIQAIALIERGPLALAVNAQSSFKTAQDVVAQAKREPGKLNYGSTGSGGASHLATELFKQRTGTDATHIPYKGGAPALNDLISNNIDMYLELPSLFIPQLNVAEPRIRVVGVAADERIKALPDVPTFKEQGIDVSASNWFGVIGPAGLPADVVNTLNTAVNKALQNPEFKQLVESQGSTVVGGTPEDFRRFIDSETELWNAVIRDQKISVN